MLSKEISYPIEAESQSSPYTIHKYWGRKPGNIVSEYIKTYTKEGDIVLDPYVGGGTTAYEAIKAGRKVIAFDVNPVATFITRCMLEPINTFYYELEFERIKDEAKKEIEKLYFTRCKHCSKKAIIKETIWQREAKGEIPIQITYSCICSRQDLVKKEGEIDKDDRYSINSINKLPIPFVYPQYIEVPAHVKVYRSSKETKRNIHEFFTHRNIIALSYLKNAIESIQDKSIKNMMLYAFSASLAHSSKLISIKKWRKGEVWKGSSWIVPGLYVLRQNCERNVWYNFEIKFKKILKTKSENFKDMVFYKPVNSYEELISGKGTAWIETRSADKLEDIPDQGIDFVFADPPYHEDISYTAQSGIFASWLGISKELSESRSSELIINKKDNINCSSEYYEAIKHQFSHIREKTRPNGNVIVAFESYDPKEWDNLVKSFINAGMKCKSIIFHPQRSSFGKAFRSSRESKSKEVFKQPNLGAYYMRLVREIEVNQKAIGKSISFEDDINQKIVSILHKRKEDTSFSTILRHLYSVLAGQKIASLPESLAEKIKSIHNPNFFIKDSQVVIKAKDNLPSGKSLGELVKERIKRIIAQRGEASSFTINSLVVRFFTKEEAIDYSYVENKISELKNEGFLNFKNGVYVPRKKLIEESIEHKHALYYLAFLGKEFDCKVWIGEKYHHNQLGKINIGDLCNVNKRDIEKILGHHNLFQNIDILWIDRNKPIYHFEIQKRKQEISKKAIKLSEELSRKFKGRVRKIIIGGKQLCDIVRMRNKKWGYWDCLAFEDLEKCYREHMKEPTSMFSANDSREESKIFQETGVIGFKGTDKGKVHCKLQFLSSNITKRIKPGQFIALSCSPETKIKTKSVNLKEAISRHNLNVASYKDLFLLRRPFSVHRIYYKGFKPEYLKKDDNIPAEFLDLLKGGYKDSFDVLFKIVGRGTEELAKLKSGNKISILGPLGNGISETTLLKTRAAYLVAGGIGIAPLYAIAERLRWLGIKVKLIVGGQESIPLRRITIDQTVEQGFRENQVSNLTTEFRKIGCEVFEVLKQQGSAVDKFDKVIEKDKERGKLEAATTRIYSCGPSNMLKAVADIANREKIECEVLLEKRMGCCIGTCLSCVCRVHEKKDDKYTDKIIHKRVCYNGPVFNSKEVKW